MQAAIVVGMITAFLVAIAVERRVLRRQLRADYRLHDTLSNLLLGLGVLVAGAFVRVAWLGADLLLREGWYLFELSPSSPLVWIAAFLAVDHCYYWFHRAGHRINVLWAAHAVHHQSQDYNFSVALRQSWVFQVFSWFFFAPLILLGFPPLMILSLRMAQAVYQYWLHTETIGKLGRIEHVLTTPSHHRVHHGRNPQYIDKNYGGILILWDRIYNSYAIEQEAVVFGTVSPLRSWNPLWANLAPYHKLLSVCRQAKSLRDRLWIWLAPPEWLPSGMGGVQHIPLVDTSESKFDVVAAGQRLGRYLAIRLVALAAMVMVFIVAFAEFGYMERIVTAMWLVMGLATIGGMIERRAWVPPVEIFRLGAAVALVAWLAPELRLALMGAGLAAVVGVVFTTIFLRAWQRNALPALT